MRNNCADRDHSGIGNYLYYLKHLPKEDKEELKEVSSKMTHLPQNSDFNIGNYAESNQIEITGLPRNFDSHNGDYIGGNPGLTNELDLNYADYAARQQSEITESNKDLGNYAVSEKMCNEKNNGRETTTITRYYQ